MQGRCRRQWPCIKAALMPEVKQKKSFLKATTPIDGFFKHWFSKATTSGEASLVWEDVFLVFWNIAFNHYLTSG